MPFPPEILAGLLAAAVLLGAGAWILRAYRRPKDREAVRRRLIDAQGRYLEGFVTDYRDDMVLYRWSWRGVEYEASQDLRGLTHPDSIKQMIGPVTVKFLTRDPANSIVLSERWSGFRRPTADSPSESSSEGGSTAA